MGQKDLYFLDWCCDPAVELFRGLRSNLRRDSEVEGWVEIRDPIAVFGCLKH